ncbi:MAG: helix-turn-helix domain protein [Herbinix sp.]|jgi:transcriptional regulator with XRE-family HTH domain|nr:helix-turn-helix domain protein [Herbinix sp.]
MLEEINKRFKLLRESCNKSQEELGKVIGISKSGVSDIENGRRNVTEQHIIMLRNWSDFHINENWLRYGEGEMFDELSEDEEMFSLISKLCSDGNELKKAALKAAAKIIDDDRFWYAIRSEMLKQIDSDKKE